MDAITPMPVYTMNRVRTNCQLRAFGWLDCILTFGIVVLLSCLTTGTVTVGGNGVDGDSTRTVAGLAGAHAKTTLLVGGGGRVLAALAVVAAVFRIAAADRKLSERRNSTKRSIGRVVLAEKVSQAAAIILTWQECRTCGWAGECE